MTITRTLILKERKNDWAIKVKVSGGQSAFINSTVVIATFIKRPMSLVALAHTFNHMVGSMFTDHQMLEASPEGLQALYSVGIEPIVEDAA